jgi:hypothetical protein
MAKNSDRTLALLARMPRWFRAQALAVTQARHERPAATDRRRELEFLCGVEVADSDLDEWQDTVAAFIESLPEPVCQPNSPPSPKPQSCNCATPSVG